MGEADGNALKKESGVAGVQELQETRVGETPSDMIGRSPEVLLVEMCAMFLKEGLVLFLKGSFPKMFELRLDWPSEKCHRRPACVAG